MRINKFIARAGIASRRKAEELILSGKITINDEVVTELGTRVAEDDIVKYDGKEIKLKEELEYILINKPVGYVSTVKDPYAIKTVLDLVSTNKRIYPVGRLDKDSRGLLLLTNDGNITFKLTHPSSDIEKEYIVRLDMEPSVEEIELLKNGIPLEGVMTKEAYVKRIKNKVYRVRISEGRNRQIRRMFEYIGYKVIDLKRVSIGNIVDNELKEGEFRYLTDKEIKYLRNL